VVQYEGKTSWIREEKLLSSKDRPLEGVISAPSSLDQVVRKSAEDTNRQYKIRRKYEKRVDQKSALFSLTFIKGESRMPP
jgi:hypothetical protein